MEDLYQAVEVFILIWLAIAGFMYFSTPDNICPPCGRGEHYGHHNAYTDTDCQPRTCTCPCSWRKR